MGNWWVNDIGRLHGFGVAASSFFGCQLMVKRPFEEPAAEEQPDKAQAVDTLQTEKSRRTATSGEDKTQIHWVQSSAIHSFSVARPHSAPPATQNAMQAATPMAVQTATPMAAEVPVEPIATAVARANQSARESFEELHAKALLRSEQNMKYWFSMVQRSSMQLAAARDGNRRELELQLEPVRNRNGEIVGYYDPDPDIDRLFVKIWTPENIIMGKATYVCFLDSTFEDTISTLKRKIQQHPNLAHMGLLNVMLLYNGKLLGDAETLLQCGIDDDCILHAVNGDDAFFDVAIPIGQASKKLHQWRILR